MLCFTARRAAEATARLLSSSAVSKDLIRSMPSSRLSSSSTTSSIIASASASASPSGIEFSGGVRVPHTPTLAFVGGTGPGTSALHPDFLSSVAREAKSATSENNVDVGDAAALAASRFASRPLPAYWTIDFAGNDVNNAVENDREDDLDEPSAVSLYASIARLQTMDSVFYESQRQGRFSFYMTSAGEEATAVGSAAALHPRDPVFAQYREQGVLLHRGFSFRDFADQCFGNELEPGKGRQMPIHYGSRELAFHTISSPLATQLPQAVGTAYALSREQAAQGLKPKDRNVAVAYFGDGASSEGDFHAAANFAAVLAGSRDGISPSSTLLDDDDSAGGTPLLLICRNNGWAISTPTSEQYAGDGIASRGPCYGIPSIRVDGGDARAVWRATKKARELALSRRGPVLIECVAYRAGHHSTSDDASRYRGAADAAAVPSSSSSSAAESAALVSAAMRDPGARFAAWLRKKGWWDAEKEKELRKEARKEAVAALSAAEKVPRANLSSMFDDVYDSPPEHLVEQRERALQHAREHPEVVPRGVKVE